MMNTAKCPNGDTLTDYIAGGLAAEQKAALEMHISTCKDCLQKISIGLKADTLYKEGGLPPASDAAVQKAKRIAPHQKRPKANLWLLATVIAFGLSFVFPKYFMQCLAAAILLGLKWIAETENMRTLILVLDSWRRHEHDRDEEIAGRLSNRGKVNINDK